MSKAFNPLEPIIRSYSFNVANRLGMLGKPRGGVYLGVELELNVDGFDRDDAFYYEWYHEPRLSDYIIPKDRCWHTGYIREACSECQRLAHDEFEDDHRRWEEDQKEKENAAKQLKYVIEKLPHFALMKEDGSVDGVEIVTAPASLRLHRNRWEGFFANLPNSFSAGDNCGMHVHLTRSALSDEQQWALNEFICDEKNEDFIREIAGREENDYCTKIKKTRKQFREAFDSHHEAVCKSEKPTLEVRIFASTTKYKVFMERLEFVAALCHFLQEGKWSDSDLRPNELAKFVRSNQLTYPALHLFLEKACVVGK